MPGKLGAKRQNNAEVALPPMAVSRIRVTGNKVDAAARCVTLSDIVNLFPFTSRMRTARGLCSSRG